MKKPFILKGWSLDDLPRTHGKDRRVKEWPAALPLDNPLNKAINGWVKMSLGW